MTIWYTLMARTLQSITAVSITALLLYNDASWRELTFLVHKGEAEGGAILQHSKDLDYGVPLGPLAISSLAFLFKNKDARCSHETPNVSEINTFLKPRGSRLRECEGEGARFLPRCRTLAPSPSHSRDLEPRVF